MLTIQYGPGHFSLNPAPACSSAPSEVITLPAALISSPSRHMTVGDGCPLDPNKSTIRTASLRLSILNASFCHTIASPPVPESVIRRQSYSSARIPSIRARTLVASIKFCCGSSESQAELMISNRANRGSGIGHFNVHQPTGSSDAVHHEVRTRTSFAKPRSCVVVCAFRTGRSAPTANHVS